MPGVIFFEGKSEIDGSPIVGIATWGSENVKTGNLVQTWIIRSDMHPVVAINEGEDSSICGDCPLRGAIRPIEEKTHKGKFDGETVNKHRACYVLVYNAPAQIYNKYKSGGYPKLTEDFAKNFFGLGLRYGSYGDPVAIPAKSWETLEKLCTGGVAPGYTHQWKNKKFSKWKTKLMASTHSLKENGDAHASGWRTFRTVNNLTEISSDEIVCPASPEAGNKKTCAMCGACDGRRNKSDARKSIAIVSHGSHKHKFVAEVIASA
jgi:hypothetical protein